MISIDKLEDQIEKLTDKIKNLNYRFHNTDLDQQAENLRNDVISLLEEYLELASQDWEEYAEKNDDE